MNVPENLDWCRHHYVTAVEEHIHCPHFGKSDGTDGACWWCMEMTPYQWHMCKDETWVNTLMSPAARIRCKTRLDAITFIEEHKQKYPMGNERTALKSEALKQATRGLHLGHKYCCSNCGKLTYMENYCSNCGAEVIQEDKE